jgi:hypothetical protein
MDNRNVIAQEDADDVNGKISFEIIKNGSSALNETTSDTAVAFTKWI